jgi:L-lactate dehydrogenase complex protein LldG
MHVAMIRANQIVARMGEALEKLTRDDVLASQLLFITGPSRTSDIENDLTIGVHGPAAVVVMMLDDGAID